MIAEKRFRRLKAPALMNDVYLGAKYVDGVSIEIALEEVAGMPFTGLFVMQVASPKVDMGYPGGDPAKTGLARVWNQWHKISERIRWRG